MQSDELSAASDVWALAMLLWEMLTERKPWEGVFHDFEGLRSATAPGVVFATREELMRHMKSDWHRHNLRLKSEGKPLLTHAEFVEYQLLAPDPDSAPKARGR